MFQVSIAQVDYHQEAPCLKQGPSLIPERVTNQQVNLLDLNIIHDVVINYEKCVSVHASGRKPHELLTGGSKESKYNRQTFTVK
jgi:hypothetical protein